jgi:hypothetical protein
MTEENNINELDNKNSNPEIQNNNMFGKENFIKILKNSGKFD